MPTTYIQVSNLLMRSLNPKSPSSILQVRSQTASYLQIYILNLLTLINICSLKVAILLILPRASRTVRHYDSSEYVPIQKQQKDNYVNLKLAWRKGATNTEISNIKKSFQKGESIPRSELLEYKVKKKNKRTHVFLLPTHLSKTALVSFVNIGK